MSGFFIYSHFHLTTFSFLTYVKTPQVFDAQCNAEAWYQTWLMGFNYAKFLPLLKCIGVDLEHFLYIVCKKSIHLQFCASVLQHNQFGCFLYIIV